MPQAWLWLFVGAGLVVTLSILWALFDEIRMRRTPKQAAAVEVYRRLKQKNPDIPIIF